MQYLQLLLKETLGVIDFCEHQTTECLIACAAHCILIMMGDENTQSSLEASTPGDLTQGRHRAGVPVRIDELPGGHNWFFEESSPAHSSTNSFGCPLNKRCWACHMITSAAGRTAEQITLMPHSRVFFDCLPCLNRAASPDVLYGPSVRQKCPQEGVRLKAVASNTGL